MGRSDLGGRGRLLHSGLLRLLLGLDRVLGGADLGDRGRLGLVVVGHLAEQGVDLWQPFASIVSVFLSYFDATTITATAPGADGSIEGMVNLDQAPVDGTYEVAATPSRPA